MQSVLTDRRPARLALCLVVAATSLGAAASPAATSARPDVTVRDPTDCITAADVEQALETRLPRGVSPSEVRVVVTVSGERWERELDVDARIRGRSFRHRFEVVEENCQSVPTLVASAVARDAEPLLDGDGGRRLVDEAPDGWYDDEPPPLRQDIADDYDDGEARRPLPDPDPYESGIEAARVDAAAQGALKWGVLGFFGGCCIGWMGIAGAALMGWLSDVDRPVLEEKDRDYRDGYRETYEKEVQKSRAFNAMVGGFLGVAAGTVSAFAIVLSPVILWTGLVLFAGAAYGLSPLLGGRGAAPTRVSGAALMPLALPLAPPTPASGLE